MEKKRVAILGVKKNEIIVNVYKKHTTMHWSLHILVIVVFLMIFTMGNSGIKSVGVTMSNIYNPVSSLYNDNSDVVFTNGILSGENLNFYVPIVADYEIMNDGTIVFEISKSIMIKAPEIGVVEKIGVTNNGVKYIKIKHSENIWSLIENVDIVGVSQNEVLTRGKDIATAKVGEIVYFQIFKDNVKINNLKIESTKIVWKD